jgi:hypothetical protein
VGGGGGGVQAAREPDGPPGMGMSDAVLILRRHEGSKKPFSLRAFEGKGLEIVSIEEARKPGRSLAEGKELSEYRAVFAVSNFDFSG